MKNILQFDLMHTQMLTLISIKLNDFICLLAATELHNLQLQIPHFCHLSSTHPVSNCTVCEAVHGDTFWHFVALSEFTCYKVQMDI